MKEFEVGDVVVVKPSSNQNFKIGNFIGVVFEVHFSDLMVRSDGVLWVCRKNQARHANYLDRIIFNCE